MEMGEEVNPETVKRQTVTLYWLELWTLLLVTLRLGLLSFGGPTAHLAYFHEEYVRRKKWLSEKDYAELVALSQFLPGPASSQVGMAIGIIRAGIVGGIVSFIGFTLPSVVVLIAFAIYVQTSQNWNMGWIQGLKLVAVAVVAHAIIGMAQKLVPDLTRKMLALCALAITLLWTSIWSQIIVIIVIGCYGYLFIRQPIAEQREPLRILVSKRVGIICLFLFVLLLFGLPIASSLFHFTWLALFDSFYRAGALVFGGGHVVLPLLQSEFVGSGLLNTDQFLAGYGLTQAVPGPLFTFASYIGTVMMGWQGGLMATIAIFLPAFLLIAGALPFWQALRKHERSNGALMAINAAVVGILIATLYNPIWISTVKGSIDFVIVAILYSLLAYWKLPPWIIVLIGLITGILLW